MRRGDFKIGHWLSLQYRVPQRQRIERLARSTKKILDKELVNHLVLVVVLKVCPYWLI